MSRFTLIHPEVDWERKFREAEFGSTSTLRRDPRKNSTTTMHLADNKGTLTRDGRPTAGQQTFFMGPAQRVVGGELRWAHPDPQPRTKMGRTQDPAELLASYLSESERASNDSSGRQAGGPAPEQQRPGSAMQPEASTSAQTQATGAFARAAEWSLARRAQTAPMGVTRRDYRQEATGTRPLVYWDGKVQHVVEPRLGHEGPAGLQEEQLGWSMREADRGRTTAGPGTTPRGTPLASRTGHSLATTARNPLGTSSRQLYGLNPAALADNALADSVRTYGLMFKPIGHKDYEETARNMEGLNCWESTQSHLTSSMRVGQPSTLMGPWEHTTSRLSLRRPMTTYQRAYQQAF